MEIQLTAQHIKEGTEGNCKLCPAALAINSVLNERYYTVVRPTSIFINHISRMYIGKEFSVPEILKDFITFYDRGYDVAPISFNLDIPSEMLRSGA